MKYKIILLAFAVFSSILLAEQPVPIAYSNEIKTIRYERTTGYTYAPKSTNYVIGYKFESTNAPAAIIHVVTYGVGSNAMFRLWTCEPLASPLEPWQCVEWKNYNYASWVTKP